MLEHPGAPEGGDEAALLDRFAPFYDLEYGDYDLDLPFLEQAAWEAAEPDRPARVLELACGSGRVLLALAAAGHACTGVDASPAMLDLARQHSAAQDVHIHLVQARMEALPPDLGPFDLALCVLNSFAYLPTQADQIAALTGVRRLLIPDGRLILDLSPVDPDGPFPANGELIHQATWERPGGGRVLKFVSGQWDAASQQQEVYWIYDEETPDGHLRRTTIPQIIRYTYRWEAQLLLERAGFRLAAAYGDYDTSPYAADSPRLILAATAV
jgi:ubiquinone/menaquinone biosynthesis C-methylase UbiE